MSLKSLENAYFAAKDAERRQALRQKLEDVAKNAAVAEHLGTKDEALAERVRKLGFEGEAAGVVDLLPLILMSWADGTVQESERHLILAVLEKRGVSPGSETCTFVETLLEQRPSAAYLKESMDVLKTLRDARGAGGNIVELCERMAEVAGGVLGMGAISRGERELLAEIADKLGGDAQTKLNQELS